MKFYIVISKKSWERLIAKEIKEYIPYQNREGMIFMSESEAADSTSDSQVALEVEMCDMLEPAPRKLVRIK